MSLIGVAIGLGNVWRFPYLVGRFGGAAFVLMYVLIALGIGVPALMGEWALGRHSRRGTVGAYAANGVRGGRTLGWVLFALVIPATAYYTNVLGWVLYYAVGELSSALGIAFRSSAVLPPETGFVLRSFLLQVGCTAAVVLACAAVLVFGLRAGIERASRLVMPALGLMLVLLIVRSLTLPGAPAGVRWYVGKFAWSDLTPVVVVTAMGHAMFSLSLGGTFMVTYGSYLRPGDDLGRDAFWTSAVDTLAGLLAGLVIFPAVFAFGLPPASGPALLFDTIPRVFQQMPAGSVFGLLFFLGLFAAGYLSDVAAFEVLVAGLVDNRRMTRQRAVWMMAAIVFVASLAPMINLRVFLRWDLTFGSGFQTVGALCAAVTAGWIMRRSALLHELGADDHSRWRRWVPFWLKYVVPGGILVVAAWWVLTEVLHVVRSV
jgi:NSS family neurotransmitter:Na+ symporter